MVRSRVALIVTVLAAALALTSSVALGLQPANPANVQPDATETAVVPGEEAPGGDDIDSDEAGAGEGAQELRTFGPQAYQRNWTWYLGVLLAATAAFAVFATAAGYYLLVVRPNSKKPA